MRLWFGAGERSGRSPVWARALGRRELRIRARPPFRFSLLLSGVQPGGWQLLQEMHPDSRRHVQRWALLSPLQGEKDQAGTGWEGGARSQETIGCPPQEAGGRRIRVLWAWPIPRKRLWYRG